MITSTSRKRKKLMTLLKSTFTFNPKYMDCHYSATFSFSKQLASEDQETFISTKIMGNTQTNLSTTV